MADPGGVTSVERYGLSYPVPFLPVDTLNVEAAAVIMLTAAIYDAGYQPTVAAVVDLRWIENDDGTAECRASLPVIPRPAPTPPQESTP